MWDVRSGTYGRIDLIDTESGIQVGQGRDGHRDLRMVRKVPVI